MQDLSYACICYDFLTFSWPSFLGTSRLAQSSQNAEEGYSWRDMCILGGSCCAVLGETAAEEEQKGRHATNGLSAKHATSVERSAPQQAGQGQDSQAVDLSNLFAGIWMEDSDETGTTEAGETTHWQFNAVPCLTP